MQFTPVRDFKLWRGDSLVADYGPGLGYTVRDGNDWLRALVVGGPLPGNQSATIEFPDLTQVQIEPGEECPGWAKEGLVTITGLGGGSGVSGSAEAKEG